MKLKILPFFVLFALLAKAQDFYSSGDCRAAFKFEVNPNIYTLLPATAINFYDASEGKVKQWYWDFGDGNTSNEQNPMFIFNHPIGGPNVKINPYRTVRLTIVTDSCKSTVAQVINIMELSVYQPQNCQARFKYYEMSRDSAAGTVTFHFDDRSDGNDLTYFWQFTDKITSTEQNPEITLPLGQPEYKVCLTVTGSDSCQSTVCEPVYVEYPNVPDTVIYPYPDCFVDFGYERKDLLMSPLPSAVFSFYSKSFPEATEWYWDFGDGATSNEPQPTHVYVFPPLSDSIKVMYNPFRTVCLTVKTAGECKVSLCQTIQVFGWAPEPDPEKCQVYFKYYRPDDVITIPEVVPIQLVDVTEGDVVSRLWLFGDGTTSNEKELLKTFDIFQPAHKVCLTVTFANGCTNTYCDAVYVNNWYTDTLVVIDPVIIDPACPYQIKVDGGFPPQMSSCAGWASVKVYYKNEEVIPKYIGWSTGDTLSKVSGLCPTQTYAVKALMPDGCVVRIDFTFNADGSVTPVLPVNWWLSGERERIYVRSDVGKGMKVEWRLCDGTIVEADSIPLDAINCGGNESNMIVKDSLGNIVYAESISLKGSFTGVNSIKIEPEVKFWPNPVTDKLNIRYSGEYQSKITVEVNDVMGRLISSETFSGIADSHEFSIDTGLLKQGIYICRVSIAGKTIKTQKFSRK